MVQLEALAILWAVKKCHIYLAGLPTFTIVTDHRPLIQILNAYTLAMIDNIKLQSNMEKLSCYQFHATWKKGTDHSIPDALSHAPVEDPHHGDDIPLPPHSRIIAALHLAIPDEESSAPRTNLVTHTQPLVDPLLQDLKMLAIADDAYQTLIPKH